jgi:hypothetical protein
MIRRPVTTLLPYLGGALVLALAGSLAACGDAGADSLSGSIGSQQPSAGPAQGSTDPGTSSQASSSVAAAVDAGPPESQGEQLFRALQTNLVSTCGGTGGMCHVTGIFQDDSTPIWLGQPDPYLSVKAFPGAITSDPYSSILLLKGPHEGPAFTGPYAALGTQVTTWLTAEALEIVAKQLPATTPVNVQNGPNVIDISSGATGIPGATIAFTAATVGSILTLTNVTVQAPTTTGLHIAHPIFAIVPPAGPVVPDPVDSFSNVDQTLTAAESEALGTGILILEGFAQGAQLEIQFNTLASVAPPTVSSDAGTAGGCVDLADFVANAVPAIQANTCLNCHNTGGPGNASLDLSQIGVDNALACAQALTKVNLTDPSQSDIILAPTGQVAAHPFKGASATYTTMMLAWITKE